MDPEVERLLRILGFKDPQEKDMKIKIIAMQYRRMSKIKHPDKPGGVKEEFQELKAAYEKLGDIITASPQEDRKDEEETNAREIFKRYNFSKENTDSITISILTKMVKHWEAVLNEKFGEPIDRTEEVAGNNNGKQWIDQAFKDETEQDTSKVFITMWRKEKKDKSTILIQCEHSKQFLNVAYVTNVIPLIYAEAVNNMKKSDKAKAVTSSPRVTRTSAKKVGTLFACKICEFETKNVGKLNIHMKEFHMKKPAQKFKEAILSFLPNTTTEITVIPTNLPKPVDEYMGPNRTPIRAH